MNIRNIFYILLFSMAMAGCKKSWLDINTNPNQLPTSTPNFVFTSGVSRLAAYLDPNEVGSYWSGQWTQSNTYIISNVQFSYQFNNTNFNFWDTWYDIAQDFEYVIRNAEANNQLFF